MLTLTDEDFHRLYTYIKKNYGIDLGKKRQLIVSRLSNMLTANGYTSFKPYVDEIISGQNRDMVTSMLNKLTTNYTYFMREEAHFNYLKDTVLPNLARAHERDRVLSIWSAGCSSGEEPYTISMYLKEFFGSQASCWDTRVRPRIPPTRRKAWAVCRNPGNRSILSKPAAAPTALRLPSNRTSYSGPLT